MIRMIIPVVDIKDNECVSGKSGNRKSYKKLRSVYGESPLEIAENLKKAGYELLYVADLDRLEKTGDNSELISRINGIIPVLLDNAIENANDVDNNQEISTYDILATESLMNLDDFERIIGEYPNDRLVVSMDIKDERLLIANDEIGVDDIIELIDNSDIGYVILLNVSRVGTKSSDKSPLEEYILERIKNVEFIMAGGITREAIKRYNNQNIDSFLVGTLLHEGKL